MILNNREVRRDMPDFAFEVAPNDAATCKSLIRKIRNRRVRVDSRCRWNDCSLCSPQQKITAWLRKCFSLLLSFNRTHV